MPLPAAVPHGRIAGRHHNALMVRWRRQTSRAGKDERAVVWRQAKRAKLSMQDVDAEGAVFLVAVAPKYGKFGFQLLSHKRLTFQFRRDLRLAIY